MEATIEKKYFSTAEMTKMIRERYAIRYGRRNVSVTKGRGTASGWIDATVNIKKPYDCFCSAGQTYCRMCRDAIQATADEARKIAHSALESYGASFHTYYGDMDNDPHDCFMLQVRIMQD